MSKTINITLIIICIIIFIVSMVYNNFYFKNQEPFNDFFTCTLQLDNIDPKFKDEGIKNIKTNRSQWFD